MVVKVLSIAALVSGVWHPPVNLSNWSFSHNTDMTNSPVMGHFSVTKS